MLCLGKTSLKPSGGEALTQTNPMSLQLNHLWLVKRTVELNTTLNGAHYEDLPPYLGHQKESLRQTNKEAFLSCENEVIIAVRRCPEAGLKRKKWKGAQKMKKANQWRYTIEGRG